MIEAKGFAKDADLARWLAMARTYVDTLPPKVKQTDERTDGRAGKWSGKPRRGATTKASMREP